LCYVVNIADTKTQRKKNKLILVKQMQIPQTALLHVRSC